MDRIKTRRTVRLFIFLYVFPLSVFAQSDSLLMQHKNSIDIEALGIGGYGSIGYGRIFLAGKKAGMTARIGLSTLNVTDYTNKLNPDVLIPLSLSVYYGRRHCVEAGLGQTISNIVEFSRKTYLPERTTHFNANFSIGYRYQRRKGLLFRCFYSPLIERYSFYRHWGGMAIGYVF